MLPPPKNNKNDTNKQHPKHPTPQNTHTHTHTHTPNKHTHTQQQQNTKENNHPAKMRQIKSATKSTIIIYITRWSTVNNSPPPPPRPIISSIQVHLFTTICKHLSFLNPIGRRTGPKHNAIRHHSVRFCSVEF